VKRQILRLAGIAAIAGAGLLTFGAPAQADQISFGNTGILSGNQSSTVIQAPISVCGNAIAVLGNARARCRGGAWAINNSGGGGGADSFFRTWSRTWS
jgi:hypothetical protein